MGTHEETRAWAVLFALATQRPGRPKPGFVQPWPVGSVEVDRGCGAIFAAPAPRQKRR